MIYLLDQILCILILIKTLKVWYYPSFTDKETGVTPEIKSQAFLEPKAVLPTSTLYGLLVLFFHRSRSTRNYYYYIIKANPDFGIKVIQTLLGGGETPALISVVFFIHIICSFCHDWHHKMILLLFVTILLYFQKTNFGRPGSSYFLSPSFFFSRGIFFLFLFDLKLDI